MISGQVSDIQHFNKAAPDYYTGLKKVVSIEI